MGQRRLVVFLCALLVLSAAPLSAASASGGSDGEAATGFAVHDPATGRWSMLGGESFYYGDPGDAALLCDWNGDGVDTVGLYRSSTGFLHLRNSNTQGLADVSIFFGIPSDRAVCGDWDGDGVDTIGVYRPAEERFYLRNTNTQGFADLTFSFRGPGDHPFAGDWDGDGVDTVGLWDPAGGKVAVGEGHGPAELWTGHFGISGDDLVVGDWDGDGTDALGIYRPSADALLLAGSLGQVVADAPLAVRDLTGEVLAGAWAGPGANPLPVGAAPEPPPPPVPAPPAWPDPPAELIPIKPGDDVAAIVNTHPEGTAFLLTAGTYRRQTVYPKAGQWFIGERGPNGERLAVFDGEGVAARAFVSRPGRDVTIQGLAVTGYSGGPSTHWAAIDATRNHSGAFIGSPGWAVLDCEVSYSNSGISVVEDGRVIGNFVHHNVRYGVTGSGRGILVEANEISHNRTDPTIDAGMSSATKFAHNVDLVVRGNWVHHNQGSGLWVDIAGIDVVIEDNLVEDNWWAGIFYEMSYRGVIRNNRVERNGLNPYTWAIGAGILVANSRDVEVYGNVVAGNREGVVGHQADRSGSAKHGPQVLANLFVHDNQISVTGGVSGVVALVDGASVYGEWANRFRANSYDLADPSGRHFFWGGRKVSAAEWEAAGQQ